MLSFVSSLESKFRFFTKIKEDKGKKTNTIIENKEAIYFSSVNECFKKCQYFLNNPKLSKKIAKKGNIKVCKILKANNDMLIRKIFLYVVVMFNY